MISLDDFRAGCELAVEELRRLAPYDTGNLAINAIRMEMNTPSECNIYVDEAVAPYMPYTNEIWEHKWIKMGNFKPGEVVERFRTWDNPNRGWWNAACELIAYILADLFEGELRAV